MATLTWPICRTLNRAAERLILEVMKLLDVNVRGCTLLKAAL